MISRWGFGAAQDLEEAGFGTRTLGLLGINIENESLGPDLNCLDGWEGASSGPRTNSNPICRKEACLSRTSARTRLGILHLC